MLKNKVTAGLKNLPFFFAKSYFHRMNLKRVVVTGLGALTPIGNNVQDYWAHLLQGVSGNARAKTGSWTAREPVLVIELCD